jgi:hypothetical protein
MAIQFFDQVVLSQSFLRGNTEHLSIEENIHRDPALTPQDKVIIQQFIDAHKAVVQALKLFATIDHDPALRRDDRLYRLLAETSRLLNIVGQSEGNPEYV